MEKKTRILIATASAIFVIAIAFTFWPSSSAVQPPPKATIDAANKIVEAARKEAESDPGPVLPPPAPSGHAIKQR